MFLLQSLLIALVAAQPVGSWPGPPQTPAPHTVGTAGPPPAWLETRKRSEWLAFSSFCWRTHVGSAGHGVCADYVLPQSRHDLPHMTVSRGSLVRLHLAFVPAEVHATIFTDGRFTHTVLRPQRTVMWRPRNSGVVSFDVRGSRGDAAYVATVAVTP